jgi:hypothetical protein
MSQMAMAIEVRDESEAVLIKNALMSPCFEKLLKLARWHNFMIDYQLFRSFRRDWYLQFQD